MISEASPHYSSTFSSFLLVEKNKATVKNVFFCVLNSKDAIRPKYGILARCVVRTFGFLCALDATNLTIIGISCVSVPWHNHVLIDDVFMQSA